MPSDGHFQIACLTVPTRNTERFERTQSTESNPVAPRSTELLDEIRESAKVGQHAAAEALRNLHQAIDEAIPEAVQPLRTTLVDAAIELADKLVAAQYQFNRNLIRTADRALSNAENEEK